MKIVDDIKAERKAGVVRCGFLDLSAPAEDVATAFGLSGAPDSLRSIDKEDAVQILTQLLQEDMAYGSPLIPESRAAELAVEFLAGFDAVSARFFTNVDYSRDGEKISRRCWTGLSWAPMTEATFDAGVIAISTARSACLWIEDED